MLAHTHTHLRAVLHGRQGKCSSMHIARADVNSVRKLTAALRVVSRNKDLLVLDSKADSRLAGRVVYRESFGLVLCLECGSGVRAGDAAVIGLNLEHPCRGWDGRKQIIPQRERIRKGRILRQRRVRTSTVVLSQKQPMGFSLDDNVEKFPNNFLTVRGRVVEIDGSLCNIRGSAWKGCLACGRFLAKPPGPQQPPPVTTFASTTGAYSNNLLNVSGPPLASSKQVDSGAPPPPSQTIAAEPKPLLVPPYEVLSDEN